MRLSKTLLVVVPVLALLAMGCGPRRPCMGPHCPYGKPGNAMMMHGCGPESCAYKSRCFSNGAVRSNDGVCQACSGGRWVEASGCTDHQHHWGCCGHPGCPGPKGGCPGPDGCPYMKGAKGAKGGKSMPCGRDGCPGGPPCHKR